VARIIGAVACSHTPPLARVDKNKRTIPSAAPISRVSRRCGGGSKTRKPDALFFIYNDHVTSFFFDHYSVFRAGHRRTLRGADEGGGPA